MKLNMIIGKKQIILASLVAILGIAIYMNYALGKEQLQSVDGGSSGANYGDAQFVDGKSVTEYFASARLDRDKSRAEAVETIQKMMKDADKESSTEVAAQVANVAKNIQYESEIETLIKAQGFQDCMVYLDGTSANIMVQTEGLIPAEAAQIKDILLSKVSVEPENITILEVKSQPSAESSSKEASTSSDGASSKPASSSSQAASTSSKTA